MNAQTEAERLIKDAFYDERNAGGTMDAAAARAAQKLVDARLLGEHEKAVTRLTEWMTSGWGRASLSASEKVDLLDWVTKGTEPRILPESEARALLGAMS